ncbi:cytochrome C [Methylovirgula ligni]|uniref:Cytochrome c oxidase cbb3-type subunit 3 n=1 Tax=Methylovirgula ligni TaxID=569860 RepID=A0A3D9YWE8_9HYPH|nr:c-type cytochrome [Methylovirgula ligni]QAY96383.1 cytochrome C [Methylovirgula ligni]REF85893.1 cytochrome c oxidase cbb3-type subunit 3 [Methylovirgula ligni]
MSLPCRHLKGAAAAAVVFAAPIAVCQSATADPNQPAAQARPQGSVLDVPVTGLFANGQKAPPPDPLDNQYENNPQAIAIGAKLFDWYNCSGCHFHGAGGIGPAFDDSVWLYGGQIDQIYASIYQGRPNGMPTWGRILPSSAIWQLAAYVKSLETNAAKVPIPTKPVAAAPGPASLETNPQEGAPSP